MGKPIQWINNMRNSPQRLGTWFSIASFTKKSLLHSMLRWYPLLASVQHILKQKKRRCGSNMIQPKKVASTSQRNYKDFESHQQNKPALDSTVAELWSHKWWYGWWRNPAPVEVGSLSDIPLFTKFHTSEVVQDFIHQQYDITLLTIYRQRFCWLSYLEVTMMDIPLESDRQVHGAVASSFCL